MVPGSEDGHGGLGVICLDNDVRMRSIRRGSARCGDIITERPPLSRWLDEHNEDAEQRISKTRV